MPNQITKKVNGIIYTKQDLTMNLIYYHLKLVERIGKVTDREFLRRYDYLMDYVQSSLKLEEEGDILEESILIEQRVADSPKSTPVSHPNILK